MQVPVDYPIEDAAHHAQFAVDELAYAIYLDRKGPDCLDESDSSPDFRIMLDLPLHYPEVVQETSRPFPDVKHSLLAFEASKRKLEPARMLSRFTGGLSR